MELRELKTEAPCLEGKPRILGASWHEIKHPGKALELEESGMGESTSEAVGQNRGFDWKREEQQKPRPALTKSMQRVLPLSQQKEAVSFL